MKRLVLLTALAVLGVAAAAVVVLDTNRPSLRQAPAQSLPTPPFADYVAGAAIAETGHGNVEIGTGLAGVVSELHVQVGQRVNRGDVLFRIDDRDPLARLAVARARVAEAAAALAKPRHRLAFLEHLQHRSASAVTAQGIRDLEDDARAAEAVLASAEAVAAQIEVEVERSQVRAPADGKILQINIRVGEYVEGAGQGRPLMLLGDDRRIYLRVDIDEHEAWRVHADATALAYVRGNARLKVALRFEYIEPFVLPRRSLTGQSTERVDVRVLQVIYSFPRDALDVYLGQQLDVFIEAPAAPTGPGHA